MSDRATHGRWSYLAAAAAAPVSAAAWRHPGLRPLAALLLHQTEEWVWPGGFLPWINREVLDSGRDEFPIGRRTGLVINVALGWTTSLAAALGPRAAPAAAVFYVSNVANVGLHVGWAARRRRYDPGLATAVLTLAPSTVLAVRRLLRDPRVSRRAAIGGVGLGLAVSAAFPLVMRRRIASGAR